MLFGELSVSSRVLADEFVSGVFAKLGENCEPPCSGGAKGPWTKAILEVLDDLGRIHGYEERYERWLVDYIWWSKKPEHLALVVESELEKTGAAVLDDFYKLPVFKCPLKMLVFSADAEEVRRVIEEHLRVLTQHVEGEEYLLVGFTIPGPRCFHFKVPSNGRLDKVQFSELPLSKKASAGN